jgi:chaperonin cofactor prefoldin
MSWVGMSKQQWENPDPQHIGDTMKEKIQQLERRIHSLEVRIEELEEEQVLSSKILQAISEIQEELSKAHPDSVL